MIHGDRKILRIMVGPCMKGGGFPGFRGDNLKWGGQRFRGVENLSELCSLLMVEFVAMKQTSRH